MQLQNKKLLIILPVSLFFLIFILIFYFATKDRSGDSTLLIDEPSGEEISTLQQEKEVYGTEQDPVLILGLAPLLESGMTMERVGYIKEQFNSFATSSNIEKISIYKNSLKTIRENEIRRHFKIRVDNQKDLSVAVKEIGVSELIITITDNSKIVYSGQSPIH